MSEPPITTRPGADAPDEPEVSVRACVATPSRVVVLFEGEPDSAAARDGANYSVTETRAPKRTYEVSRPEFDPRSRVTVLRNPVGDVDVGDWLEVAISGLRRTAEPIIHFAQVESELPLLGAGLVDGAASARGERPDAAEATGATGSPAQAEEDKRNANASATSRARGKLDMMPALVIVIAGLLALVILGVVAMALAAAGEMGTIASAAFGVIGSVVGAFFGVHAGLGDRRRVDDERRVEATKGQMLAAMVPENQTRAALNMLKEYSPSEPSAGPQ